MRDDPVEIVVRGKRYRVVWWDWKEHVPIDELSDAPKQGLVWMRMVLDTHCDQYGLIRSDPMSPTTTLVPRTPDLPRRRMMRPPTRTTRLGVLIVVRTRFLVTTPG